MIKAKDLRDKWINFFVRKAHLDVSDQSLIPHSSDKSLLFINSGVAAIKPYFYGDIPTPSKRLVSCQKVIRTGDIESIGESVRHHTYFEMLGNFSIGDYFKSEAIAWAWEFLTKEINLDPNKFFITVLDEDKDAYQEWLKWVPSGRIIKCSKDTNFWDMGVGPCGSCSEIYYDRGEEYNPRNAEELIKNNVDNNRFLEVWNIVFSEFLNVDGKIVSAPTKNIDTGAGLERLLAILENKSSNFETSLFEPIISFLKIKTTLPKQALWAPADYLRTSCMLITEGIPFGNKGRSYVLRKIFRKTIRIFKNFDLNKDFFEKVVSTVGNTLPYHPKILAKRDFIAQTMFEEAQLAKQTIFISQRFLSEIMKRHDSLIPANEIFNLVTRYGLSIEIIDSILKENNRSFDLGEFNRLMEAHRAISFNSNISSAFAKKIPSLIDLTVESRMNYEKEEIESVVNALFDEQFNGTNEIDGWGYIILSETTVFPLSGGQDCDNGWINGNKIDSSVKGPNGQILHKVKCNLKVGDSVIVKHDVEKRRNLSMHHTLEHMFYEVLKREVHVDIDRISGQKYDDCFSMEIRTPESIDRGHFNVKYLNSKLKEMISKGFEVSISSITLEDSKSMGLSQKFEAVYRKTAGNLRLVDIGGYSKELCAGTHVKNTSEIDDSLIVEFKKKQPNVYKFRVVAGSKNIDHALTLISKKKNRNMDRLNIWDPETNPEINKSKRYVFLKKKQEIIDELMKCESIVVRMNIEIFMALSVFKEIKPKLQNKTIFLISEHRYYVASDVINVKEALQGFRDKYGWKGGGNERFGSGMMFSSIPDEEIIQHLKAYSS